MREEIRSAVDFLQTLVSKQKINPDKLDDFNQCLFVQLCTHYHNHWFPEKPFKGSGYRCLRIVNQKMDPIIARAGADCGITETQLLTYLPSELTMWVDPDDVSYRIGEDGSIGVLFSGSEDLDDSSSDSLDSSSSDNSAMVIPQGYQVSPSPSPTQQDFPAAPAPVGHADFLQACKDEVRYFFPEALSQDAMNFEYLAQYVAS